VVDVSVSSKDPAKAASLANAIAQAYLAEQTKVRADAARQVSVSLSARLKELQGRVRDAEERVESYKAQHNIVDVNGQLVGEQQLSDLNNQLSVAHARVAQSKARLDQIQAMQKSADVGAFAEAVQSPTITALRSQYAEVTRREAEQKISLGERHPAVIEIEAQAQRLQKMIADEINRIAVSARSDYESAKANEETLTQNLDTLKHTTITTNASLVGLRELEREVQANRAVYEAFLVRARETGEQELVDTKNIRVISKADLPLRRTSPPSSLIIGLVALIFGAASGAGLVLMRGAFPGRAPKRSPRPSVRQRLIPFDRRSAASRGQSDLVPVLADLPNVDVTDGLRAVDDPQSRFARQIQKVYDALRGDSRGGSGPSVLVVSADDEDNTTTVALSLAAAAAAKQRVLLIDADLECRTLSTIDAADSDAGLVDVATGRRELTDAIVRDPQTNINLLAFVSPNSRRDRPISDADVRRAFDKTRRFDMVIVAALNPSRDPGGRFFAGLVDHIIVVARTDKAAAIATAAWAANLGANAAKIRGTVLTGDTAA
jgi:Mrp family chromosome partitioning ATPase/capsular polysaccharide biosynthesis protein